MITLVLGGARSGKSTFAERLAARSLGPVTYVATMVLDDDVDVRARVAAHRLRRPAQWTTVDSEIDLERILRTRSGTILIDSLGPWIARLPNLECDVEGLCSALSARNDDTIIVSDEVGLGVHPATALGRDFRDVLGSLNQAIARVADRVLLIVAGRALTLLADGE